MKWSEFKAMLAGLGPDTVLGRVVAIRLEDDKDILKHFSKEQLRIRREWRDKKAQSVSTEETMAFLENMKQALIKLAGGTKT